MGRTSDFLQLHVAFVKLGIGAVVLASATIIPTAASAGPVVFCLSGCFSKPQHVVL